ncbi:MAG: hypothetical protein IPK82_29245 [Polyangiaceae bacterium]|nr:hypothetical protein [Polyangiaceae bacterium]
MGRSKGTPKIGSVVAYGPPDRQEIEKGVAMNATSLLVLASLSALSLVSCKPPIACSPGEVARRETLCPACPTIDNPPPGYCPCTESWVCRETEEHARQRRAQQQKQVVQQQAMAHQMVALDAERERLVWENRSRRANAIGNYCDPKAALGCPRDTWPMLEETAERTPQGLPVYRQVCTPFGGIVGHPPCYDPEKEAAQKRLRERSDAAFALARQQCTTLKCRPPTTAQIHFVCSAPADASPNQTQNRLVRMRPTCEYLAQPPNPNDVIGCSEDTPELTVEPVCQPPEPRLPIGTRKQ